MTQHSQPVESSAISIQHVGEILRLGVLRLALGLLAGLAVGAGLFAITPPTYSSRAVVAITPTVASSSFSAKDISTATEGAVVASTSVAERAAPALQWTAGAANLLGHVAVSSPLDSQLLVIHFTAASPALASRGANAFAEGYLSYRLDIAEAELKARSDRLDQRIAVLERVVTDQTAIIAKNQPSSSAAAQAGSSRASAQRLIGQLRDQQVNVQTTVVSPGQVIDRGLPPTTRNFPRLPVFLLGGALLGALVGVAAAFWRSAHDTRVRDAAQLESGLGVTVLARIPVPVHPRRSNAPVAAMTHRDGLEADGYRTLAAKLVTDSSTRSHAILIVGAGSLTITTTPLNLAVTLAAQGHRVLLTGLSKAMLQAAVSVQDDAKIERPGDDLEVLLQRRQLSIVSLGREVTLEATLRRRADDLQQFVSSHDLVVVDSLNVEMASTSLALARLCDRAVVVTQQSRTQTGDVRSMLHELENQRSQVSGAVLLRAVAERRPRSSPTTGRDLLEGSLADLATPRLSKS